MKLQLLFCRLIGIVMTLLVVNQAQILQIVMIQKNSHVFVVQKLMKYRKKTSRYNKYTKRVDVTEAELLAFFGVTLAMGLINLPKMRDYWSTSSFMSVPWFRSIFTRGRYEQIQLQPQLLTFLHLVNNKNTPSKESPEYKLYKLGSLPETLSKTYQEYYKT